MNLLEKIDEAKEGLEEARAKDNTLMIGYYRGLIYAYEDIIESGMDK